MTKKLYKVELRGFKPIFTVCNYKYGISYVVAENSDNAYNLVKKFLEDKNYGDSSARELYKIELLAENYDYPNCGTKLFIEGN